MIPVCLDTPAYGTVESLSSRHSQATERPALVSRRLCHHAAHPQHGRHSAKFNPDARITYALRVLNFQQSIRTFYDLFYDLNGLLLTRSLERFDEMLRPTARSGIILDLLTASLAKHARSLTTNR